MQKPENGHRKALHFHQPPQRVVSLVPSMTESMFDLGFGNAVVGVTDYCIHPAESLAEMPRVGGTKTPNIDAILDLRPDLILANWEENQLSTVEALEANGMPVWVTFPKSVNEAIEVLWTLTGLFHSREAAVRIQTLELTLDWASSAASEKTPIRYFCPIWYSQDQDEIPWWMTFNRHTYAHDLLEILGGENLFADRQRRYPLQADLGIIEAEDPGERDTRYPRLIIDEVRLANPEIILLPDEPFPFEDDHNTLLCASLADIEAVKNNRIHRLDGTLITWHGTRLARALREIPSLLA